MAFKVSISTLQLLVAHNFCKDHSVLKCSWGYRTAMFIPVGGKSAFKGFSVIRWKLRPYIEENVRYFFSVFKKV